MTITDRDPDQAPAEVPAPPYADVPALLARANQLISGPLDPAGQNPTWLADALQWRDDYAAALPALQHPHGAVLTIVEELRRGEDPDDGVGVLVPTRAEINGMPLLITEDGPVIEKIDLRPGSPRAAAVTITMFARRVTIDGRPKRMTAGT